MPKTPFGNPLGGEGKKSMFTSQGDQGKNSLFGGTSGGKGLGFPTPGDAKASGGLGLKMPPGTDAKKPLFGNPASGGGGGLFKGSKPGGLGMNLGAQKTGDDGKKSMFGVPQTGGKTNFSFGKSTSSGTSSMFGGGNKMGSSLGMFGKKPVDKNPAPGLATDNKPNPLFKKDNGASKIGTNPMPSAPKEDKKNPLFSSNTEKSNNPLSNLGSKSGSIPSSGLTFGEDKKSSLGFNFGGTGKTGALNLGAPKSDTSKTFDFGKKLGANDPKTTTNADTETKKKETLAFTNDKDTKKKENVLGTKPTGSLFGDLKKQSQTGGLSLNLGTKPSSSGLNFGQKTSTTGATEGLFKPKTLETNAEKKDATQSLFKPKTGANPLGNLGADKPKAPTLTNSFSFKESNPLSGATQPKTGGVFPNFAQKTGATGDTQGKSLFSSKPKEGGGLTLGLTKPPGQPTMGQAKPLSGKPEPAKNLFGVTENKSNLKLPTGGVDPKAPNKPEATMESIALEKLQNKRVLEIQNEWEENTKEIRQNMKKLGVSVNQNEDHLRKAMKTLDELKSSQQAINGECKYLQANLEKIISDQKNVNMQLDLMNRELDSVLTQNDFFELDEYDAEDVFAQTGVVGSKLNVHENTMAEFTKRIGADRQVDDLDGRFNKTLNNYFESLHLLENQIELIDQSLFGAYGRRHFV